MDCIRTYPSSALISSCKSGKPDLQCRARQRQRRGSTACAPSPFLPNHTPAPCDPISPISPQLRKCFAKTREAPRPDRVRCPHPPTPKETHHTPPQKPPPPQP